MRICGMQGISVIDFPGKVASVVFLGGCNFRCPFCHNPELVLRAESQPDISLGDALRTIERRRELVDGVVITGGEPLINGDELFALLCQLRELGLAVKLDTNGYEIDALRKVLETGLVDFVAMDVKTSLDKYEAAAGRALDTGRVRDAIAAISGSSIDHEFRTTCVPGLVELDDVMSIARMLGGSERYVLQQFRATSVVIDASYAGLKPHTPDSLRALADAVRPLVGSVSTRGV